MKFKLFMVAIATNLSLQACQNSSSHNEATDTTSIYQPAEDTSKSNSPDTTIETTGDSASGTQAGGSRVNIGKDTAGQ